VHVLKFVPVHRLDKTLCNNTEAWIKLCNNTENWIKLYAIILKPEFYAIILKPG
jgi:hypothetical protein